MSHAESAGNVRGEKIVDNIPVIKNQSKKISRPKVLLPGFSVGSQKSNLLPIGELQITKVQALERDIPRMSGGKAATPNSGPLVRGA